MRCHNTINENTQRLSLVFWKDRKDCQRYYCRRSEGTPESEKHNIDLAMEYGSKILFTGQDNLDLFLKEYPSAWIS